MRHNMHKFYLTDAYIRNIMKMILIFYYVMFPSTQTEIKRNSVKTGLKTSKFRLKFNIFLSLMQDFTDFPIYRFT